MKQVNLSPQNSDELDITVLLQNAIYFFSHYGKLLVAVALAGIVAGVLRFWFTPNIYSSSLLLQPTLLSDPEQLELIDNWSVLLKKKELPGLAQQFNIDKSLLKKVLSIKTEELQKSYAPNNFTAFNLTVLVSNPLILPQLQKGILHALNNSAYIKDKLISRKNTLRTLIQTVQQQLDRLYKLQTTIEGNMQWGNTNNGRYIVDVSGISSQIAVLHEKKLGFEESLAFTSAVNVLQNFYTPAKPTYPQLLKQLLLGCAGGMMLGCAIAFYLHLRQKMKTY